MDRERSGVHLNFAQAQVAATEGALIKRGLWDAYVRRWEDGRMTFLLPAKLAKELGTEYDPTSIDRTANDWQVKR